MNGDSRSFNRLGWIAIVLLTAGLGSAALAQETGSKGASPASAQAGEASQSNPEHPLAGEVAKENLAKEDKEADSHEHLKHSPSVAWIAKQTGLSLNGAYRLAVGLNFAVIVGLVLWAGRKYLPSMFRDRTTAIQKAMEEARRASEDANRRLADIELRLSKLGDEVNSMKAAGEKDIAEEEARIKAAAEEDGRKIVESAEQEIAAAAKSARRDLTAYAADLALALAKRQIQVDGGTDERLVRSFAENLGKPGEGSKN
jgi:F-type H+-transporting ATPase subunit b